jgi:hypothetical protein
MGEGDFANILQRIRQLQSSDDTYPELLKQMHGLAALAPISVASIHDPGVKLFRSTAHHRTVPARIEEIWYPPAEILTTFGRANRPGSPVFYCCSDPTGSFLEARAQVGDYATFATWETITEMIVHHVGYSDAVMVRAGIARDLLEVDRELHKRLEGEGVAAIREFLSLSFTDPQPSHYRVTAAIAEMFMAADTIAGIKYPSIAKNARVDNLALLPEFVRAGVRLAEASVVRVEKMSQESMEGKVIARLAAERAGDLSWRYEGDSTSLEPGKSVSMLLKPGDSKRIVSAGRMSVNGQTYDVLPGYSIELRDGNFVVLDLKSRVVDPIH